MTMKKPHYIFFFRHNQCEWSVSCTWVRTYRDTTPLNLLLKSARTFRPLCTAVLVHIRKSKKPFPHLIISILHAAHSLATTSAVHCMRSNPIRRSTHRKMYSLKLPTGCRVVRKRLPTDSSFAILSVTHRKSLCLSVTHRKLSLLKVTHRKI